MIDETKSDGPVLDVPADTSSSPTLRGSPRYWFGLFLLGLVACFIVVAASRVNKSGALTLSPTHGTAGAEVVATGHAFPPSTRLTLTWDGSDAGMPSVMSDDQGRFDVSFAVPQSQVGAHVVSVSTLGTIVRSRFRLEPEEALAPSPVRVDTVATPAPTSTTAGPTPTSAQSPGTIPTSEPTRPPRPGPTSRATHAPNPTRTPAPGTKTVQVSSIKSLLSALADNTVDTIVVANGTYHVSPTGSQRSDSLWIGSQFAGRTRPITVRAATRGHVTFDGGGATGFGCISFNGGAHNQTWDGFNCANGQATNTGIVTFGGYAGLAAPHHITMRHISILASCTGRATSAASPTLDHAFYISYAVGGPHDLLFEDISVNGAGHLASAFHFFHSDSVNRNARNVTVRRLHVRGTQQAIILWDPTLRNITFDTADITNALSIAVRYETKGPTGIVFKNIRSTGSGTAGFYSTQGTRPSGVTFSNDHFD